MGVVDVKLDWSREAAGGSLEERTASRGYTVLFDAADPPTLRALLAQVAPGIPQPGESHPGDPARRAGRCQVRARSPVLYEVVVEYRAAAGGAADGEDDPLNQPARRRWTWASSQEPIDYDFAGAPIRNSADQPFEPPPTAEVFDPELVIERNEADDDPRLRLLYRMAINADAFYGAEPGQAMLLPIEAEEVRLPAGRAGQREVVYWRKVYRIRFRRGPEERDAARKAWLLRILDQGMREKRWNSQTAKNEYRQIVDDQGLPIDRPVPLNGAGLRLGADQQPKWLYFQMSPILPFAVFRLEPRQTGPLPAMTAYPVLPTGR